MNNNHYVQYRDHEGELNVAPAQQRGNDDVENIERSDGERNPVGVGGVGGIQPQVINRFRQYLEPMLIPGGMALNYSKNDETNYICGENSKSLKSNIEGGFSIAFTYAIAYI
jgi:hypothetical protein